MPPSEKGSLSFERKDLPDRAQFFLRNSAATPVPDVFVEVTETQLFNEISGPEYQEPKAPVVKSEVIKLEPIPAEGSVLVYEGALPPPWTTSMSRYSATYRTMIFVVSGPDISFVDSFLLRRKK